MQDPLWFPLSTELARKYGDNPYIICSFAGPQSAVRTKDTFLSVHGVSNNELQAREFLDELTRNKSVPRQAMVLKAGYCFCLTQDPANMTNEAYQNKKCLEIMTSNYARMQAMDQQVIDRMNQDKARMRAELEEAAKQVLKQEQKLSKNQKRRLKEKAKREKEKVASKDQKKEPGPAKDIAAPASVEVVDTDTLIKERKTEKEKEEEDRRQVASSRKSKIDYAATCPLVLKNPAHQYILFHSIWHLGDPSKPLDEPVIMIVGATDEKQITQFGNDYRDEMKHVCAILGEPFSVATNAWFTTRPRRELCKEISHPTKEIQGTLNWQRKQEKEEAKLVDTAIEQQKAVQELFEKRAKIEKQTVFKDLHDLDAELAALKKTSLEEPSAPR